MNRQLMVLVNVVAFFYLLIKMKLLEINCSLNSTFLECAPQIKREARTLHLDIFGLIWLTIFTVVFVDDIILWTSLRLKLNENSESSRQQCIWCWIYKGLGKWKFWSKSRFIFSLPPITFLLMTTKSLDDWMGIIVAYVYHTKRTESKRLSSKWKRMNEPLTWHQIHIAIIT